MSEWRVGPDLDLEVFSGEHYRKHSNPGDYTRSVVIAGERLRQGP